MNLVLQQLFSLEAACEDGVGEWIAAMVEATAPVQLACLNAHWTKAPEETQYAIALALGISEAHAKETVTWTGLPQALRDQYRALDTTINNLMA